MESSWFRPLRSSLHRHGKEVFGKKVVEMHTNKVLQIAPDRSRSLQIAMDLCMDLCVDLYMNLCMDLCMDLCT